jgi:hypothetical protein
VTGCQSLEEGQRSPKGSSCSPLDVLCLQSLVTLDDFELDDLTFVQGFEALPEDRGMMHEDILTGLLDDETETLLVVEPLDLAAAGHSLSPDFGAQSKKKERLVVPTIQRSLSNDERLHAPKHFGGI